jgi:hypothetical protein
MLVKRVACLAKSWREQRGRFVDLSVARLRARRYPLFKGGLIDRITLPHHAQTADSAHDSLLFADGRDLGAQDRRVIYRRLPDQWPIDAEVLVHQNIA